MGCIIKQFKTSVAAKGDYVKEDDEVKAIYDAIKSNNDNTVDLSQTREDANHDDVFDQNENTKGLSALKKFVIGRDDVEVSYRLGTFCSRSFEVYTEENKTEGSRDRLIHTAALFSKDISIIELLTKYCPTFITENRTGGYAGQTALHITIFKEKFRATEVLLKAAKSYNLQNEIWSARATGSNFKNNIMMGETVFSVAVLTLKPKMVDLLLDHGAPIEELNSKGDNVIHTLIKYAAIKPDSIPKVIKMLKHLREKTLNKYKDPDKTDMLVAKLWFEENKNHETPLKLSVSKGLIDVFNALMKMKSIFYFPCKNEGSFDLRFYDITEIDHINQLEYTKNKLEKTRSFCPSCSCCPSCFFVKKRISITEKLCDLKWETALPFIDDYDVHIIKAIVSKRYNNCLKIVYFLYACIHLIVLLLFTISIFYRKEVSNTKCSDSCRIKYYFSQVLPWILMIYGFVMIALEFVRCLALKKIDLFFKPYKKSQGKFECFKEMLKRLIMRYHQNDLYRIGQLVFAICLVVDCFMYNVQKEDKNDLTVTALFSGVWLTFFFFKGLDKFSIYTVIFQKVIMGDLFRFGIWIVIEFTAFCFAMYIVLSDNTKEVEEFSGFTNTTLTMFSYMLGLKDLSFLDEVDDTSQHLVAIIYVLCIVVTYILLINSLIAMMSKNAVDTFEHRKSMILLQKFSVVLFLDPILFIFCLRTPINERLSSGTISNLRKDNLRKDRFYLAIKTEKSGTFKRQYKERNSLGNLALRDLKKGLLKTKQTFSKENKKMFDMLKVAFSKTPRPRTPSLEGEEDSHSETESIIDIRSEPRTPDNSDPMLDIDNHF